MNPTGPGAADALFYPPPASANDLIGLPRLMEMSLHELDLRPVATDLFNRLADHPDNANATLDLALLLHLGGNRDLALQTQALALATTRLYHLPAVGTERLRLLVLMTPGDLAANMPVEFLLHGSNIALDMLYLMPGEELSHRYPRHDVICIGVCESDANRPLLQRLAAVEKHFAKPLINPASSILGLSRESVSATLAGTTGCHVPPVVRLTRQALQSVAAGDVAIDRWLPGANFPLICRPTGSHAGRGLVKLDSAADAGGPLMTEASTEFVVSPFIDYRSADGLFRKYRVAFVAGKPYPVHMAVSARWMVHYLNADMLECAEHRAEEQHFFETFDTGFAQRHADALAALPARLQLDYFSIDCGETADGRLLVFEADSGNVVHAMDPVHLFSYKRPHMRRVFAAFQTLLAATAASPSQPASAVALKV